MAPTTVYTHLEIYLVCSTCWIEWLESLGCCVRWLSWMFLVLIWSLKQQPF